MIGRRETVEHPLDQGYLRLKDQGTNKVVLDTAGSSYFNGGNVGIGTTSPDTKLDIDGLVNGGIAFTATQVEIDRQSVLPNGRIFYNDSRLIYDSPANGHRFAVAGNQEGSNIAMVIDSGQRVGIGTTAPTSAYKLDVRGRVRIENDVPELSLKDTDGTNQIASIRVIQGNGLVLSSQDNTSNGLIRFLGNNGTTESEYARITSTGSLAIGQTAAPQKLTVAGNITVTGTTGIQIATISRVSDAGRFELRDSGGTTRVEINASGDSYFNASSSSLGIGTSSPQRNLDVRHGLNIFGSGGYTELMLRGRAGTAQNLGAWHWSIRGDVGGANDDLMLLRFTGGIAPVMQVLLCIFVMITDMWALEQIQDSLRHTYM